jgi:hypothetical protein
MLTIKIHIDEETRKAIKDTYGKDDYETVNGVVNNIIARYLDVEHFDPKLSTGEDGSYKTCESCGEKSKSNKIIDVDGKNLEEHDVCENCGNGYPVLM